MARDEIIGLYDEIHRPTESNVPPFDSLVPRPAQLFQRLHAVCSFVQLKAALNFHRLHAVHVLSCN